MEVSVTRRVIGATVLAMIAVVVLPYLFDGDGRIPNREALKIPPVIKKPDVSELRVDLPVEARAETNIQPKTESDVIATRDVPNPTVNESAPVVPKGTVWSLQVASFKESVNAARLRDSLRDSGFRAYNKENRLSDGSLLTQVLVGPVQTYDLAMDLKVKLAIEGKSLGVSGAPLIIRYVP